MHDVRAQPERGGGAGSGIVLNRGVLGPDVAQKGVYLCITFTFSCQHDQPVGCALAD